MLFFIICLGSYVHGNVIVDAANSATYEIEGILYYVLAGIFLIGGVICLSLGIIEISVWNMIPKKEEEIGENSE